MKKALLIALALGFLLGASALAAQGRMKGTFSGTRSGTWEGIIVLSDPDEDTPYPIFDGTWISYSKPYSGIIRGIGYISGNCYVFEEADIFDQNYELIGHWAAIIPSPASRDTFTGPWYTFDGGEGDWRGWWVK